MKASRQLRIWTIITHALIIVGMGHGIGCFALIEIIAVPIFLNSLAYNSSDSSGTLLLIVGLSSLMGQFAIIYSLFTKRTNLKITFHIIGLLFLWTSIICFQYITSKDHYTHLITITCLPFLICTIIFLAGQPIKRFYNRIVDI